MNHRFAWSVFRLSFLVLFTYPLEVRSQKQDFETVFSFRSFPDEFLPGWLGNDVRATSSRIFQSLNLGRAGSKALVVQPLSTFSGEIWIKLNPSVFNQPRVVLWARSQQNGTGNRPTVVSYSWGESLTGSFLFKTILGSEGEFKNENQEFRKFQFSMPEQFSNQEEVILKIEIQQGQGSGSAARWFLDDFELVNFIEDNIPPRLTQLKGYTNNELLVEFDEPVDPVFSVFPLSYKLDEEMPETVRPLNDSSVIVKFGKELEEGRKYRFAVSQIPDLEGNFLKDTILEFSFTDPTALEYKFLVINELMPAPRSEEDLPNVEFVELFNSSDKEIRLGGLVLSNSKSGGVLSEYWIQPLEYVILAPSNQAGLLSTFGSVIPVHPWPSLLNAGEVLTLSVPTTGLMVDQLSYTTSSWGGNEFANGGYSLEVANPFFLCDNSEFLNPSLDPAKGTPGRKNSTFSKEIKNKELTLESAVFLNPSLLELVFNQPLVSKIQTGQFSISPDVPIDSIQLSSSGRTVQLWFAKPVVSSLPYELKITSLLTCQGEINNEFIVSRVVLLEEAKPGELILNEVLFDPRSGDPKFVEIHNQSDAFLSIDGWALANFDEFRQPDQIRVFGNKGNYLEPKSFLAISTDSTRLILTYPKSSFGKFLQLRSLPSFPIGGGTVVLISDKGRLEDQFTYDAAMHHPLIRNTKGVSLERISGKTSAENRSNWQSSSSSEDFATPGRQNSMTITGELESNLLRIEPEVFDPEGSLGPAFTTIRYELDKPGWMGSISVYNASGLLVSTLAENQLLGTTGLFTWSGTDMTGAKVRVGYYVVLAEFFDLTGRVSVIKKTVVVATRL